MMANKRRGTQPVAVITGASSGIGLATAHRAVDDGYLVVLVSNEPEALERASGEFDAKAVSTWCCDVSQPDQVESLVKDVIQRHGRVDILVANAGLALSRPFLELTPEDWRQVHNVNVFGSFLCGQAFGRVMARQHQGSIVLTASTNGLIAEPQLAAYNASKAAVILLAQSMAIDLAHYGIRVNVVAPGTIRTRATARYFASPTGLSSIPTIPLQRVGTPDDVATAILFLASSDAAYITGAVLVVDGGQTIVNGPLPVNVPYHLNTLS